MVSTYQWLLGIHVLAAFLFVGGAVATGALQLAALRCERPSEIATLLRLTKIGVALVSVGSIGTLAFGIWLVDDRPYYEIGEGWIVAALVLWFVSGALAGPGGRKAKGARLLAERLAAAGDRPSPELRRLVADPVALALNYASLAALLAILGLMFWKP